jgi:hypothetical protein
MNLLSEAIFRGGDFLSIKDAIAGLRGTPGFEGSRHRQIQHHPFSIRSALIGWCLEKALVALI